MRYAASILALVTTVLLNACYSGSPQETKSTSVSIYTDFEGGNLGEVAQISDTVWRCSLSGESDWDNRNRQASWYYFRMEGTKDKAITVELTDLVGEYNFKPGSHAVTSQTRPVISYNKKHWRHLTDEEVSWDEENIELILKFKALEDTLWVAHQAPYTPTDLSNLAAAFEANPKMTVASIGETVDKRPMQLFTITDSIVPLAKKKVIWIMGRQHSWESGTSYVVEGAIKYLLDTSDGESLLANHVFKIIPMADPDGSARGGVRFNKFGHDLNRNWDLVKPEEMPEIYSQKKAVSDWQSEGNPIHFFLTLHNTESADYVEGPDLPVGKKFWEGMVANTSFESEEGLRIMPATTTAGMKGRMTVIQGLWAEMKVPAYLIELKVEKVNKLNSRRQVSDWLQLGEGLVRAATKAVE